MFGIQSNTGFLESCYSGKVKTFINAFVAWIQKYIKEKKK